MILEFRLENLIFFRELADAGLELVSQLDDLAFARECTEGLLNLLKLYYLDFFRHELLQHPNSFLSIPVIISQISQRSLELVIFCRELFLVFQAVTFLGESSCCVLNMDNHLLAIFLMIFPCDTPLSFSFHRIYCFLGANLKFVQVGDRAKRLQLVVDLLLLDLGGVVFQR